MAALFLFVAACAPKIPEGAREIQLQPVARKGPGVVSQFETTGTAVSIPQLYWLYLPESRVGRLFLKVTSVDGSVVLVRQKSLTPSGGPGELCSFQPENPSECELGVDQPQNGEYFFLIYSQSGKSTEYRLFVGSAFREL